MLKFSMLLAFVAGLALAGPAEAQRYEPLQTQTDNAQELIDLLRQWFGLCLVADTSYQKLLMLIGPRRSGKGTICRTLQHVIGPDKCTSPTLTSLGGEFGLWQLIGADVAILADAHLGRRADSTRVLEVIKSIVGEDPQNINRKCLPFLQNVRLSTRFVLTVNELPHFSDVSGALVSRLLVIPSTPRVSFPVAGKGNPPFVRADVDHQR